LNAAAPAPLDEATIVRVLQLSRSEAAAGRIQESDQLLASIAQQAPNHPAVLNELGVRMLDRGAPQQAQALFARATVADPKHPALWANLASSLKALGRRTEELDAIGKALELEPRHLSALLQKGAYHEDHSDKRAAARAYQNLLACIAPGTEPPPNIKEAVAHARQVVDADLAELTASLESQLAPVRERHGGRRQRRVDLCLETLMGTRQSFYSQPTWMYMPELPAIEFFERSEFPWLDAFESETAGMRKELLQILVADREGLQPYIDFPPDMPLDQFRELNRSRRWSAYFLQSQGTEMPSHLARCPLTARLLATAPRCFIEDHAPTAFFSVLDANTRIPAHIGVTNTRCTVHVPLVIPPDCGFRVGSTTREWVPGQAWVFDDTINHEAWNLSDTPRAILIFDIWNPLLSAAERDLIKTATEIYARHYSLKPGQQL
jgi:aspartyl/asparaginyl beta-hydroxylase (cupin superfamily)